MTIQAILKSQYRASLDMLLDAIETCPPELWASDRYVNPSWQVAYHTLYYMDLYLQASENTFVPWEHHREGHHRFARESGAPATLQPYTVEEVRTYASRLRDSLDATLARLDLTSPESGISWYRMSKLELQILNLRHLQHHTGQLADRIRQTADRGIEWVGDGPGD